MSESAKSDTVTWHDQLHPINSRMHGKEEFSDMTLVCGDRIWKLHKVIVLPLSNVLRTALEKEPWNQSANSTAITDSDLFDADTVSRMVQYIYTASYGVSNCRNLKVEKLHESNSIFINELLQHFKVYAIADYYEMKELMAHVEDYVSQNHSGRQYDPEIVKIIVALASLTPSSSSLRDFTLRYAVKHARKLLRDEEYIRERKGNQVVQEFHDSLCLLLADEPRHCSRCDRCGWHFAPSWRSRSTSRHSTTRSPQRSTSRDPTSQHFAFLPTDFVDWPGAGT